MNLTVLSFGAGQDSTAIALKLMLNADFRAQYAPGELIAIMADTGNEHPHTYAHVTAMEALFEKFQIPFIFTGDEYRTDSWKGGLLGQWTRMSGIGSKAYPKTCTDKLKVQPIYKALADYLESRGFGESYRKKSLYDYTAKHGKIQVLIGIAASEEKRMAKPGSVKAKWMSENIEIRYPLVDLGMDRAACQQYISSMEPATGLACPMPSNCMYCPFNQEFDLVWLQRNHPAQLQEWQDLEAAKLAKHADKGDKNLGVWGKPGVTLADKMVEAQEQYGHMTDAELNEYKFSHGHCVASAY